MTILAPHLPLAGLPTTAALPLEWSLRELLEVLAGEFGAVIYDQAGDPHMPEQPDVEDAIELVDCALLEQDQERDVESYQLTARGEAVLFALLDAAGWRLG